MTLNHIFGLLIILLAYSTVWVLLITSNKIIAAIEKNELTDLDDIREKLNI